MSEQLIPLWKLRADFAISLAELYGNEVPAYNTLVEVSREVNERYIAKNGHEAERLGSVDRVTAERHGAIRVGSVKEMSQAARIFGGFGMYPVGFYDLRDAMKSSVPVVSTAYRPIAADELAKNPFRVFCSMLVHNDRRFFDQETEDQLREFVENRTLFPEDLLELADRSAKQAGLNTEDAKRFLELATLVFKLDNEPVDHDWYFKLEKISSVASDIGGVPSTHINHLTPRVLDIDDLYNTMSSHGIVMIDEIQGPPDWEGPDVLLRQTSFKALSEDRLFRHADGSIKPGQLRVRFGEVEQRGIALTPKGRDLYDRLVAEVDERLQSASDGSTRVDVAREVWREKMPRTEAQLAGERLGYFTFEVKDKEKAAGLQGATLADLINSGVLEPQPIVYEDFLPRSAAGIFKSNLTDDGSRNDELDGVYYDIEKLSNQIGVKISDPMDLYAKQEDASIKLAERELGIVIS